MDARLLEAVKGLNLDEIEEILGIKNLTDDQLKHLLDQVIKNEVLLSKIGYEARQRAVAKETKRKYAGVEKSYVAAEGIGEHVLSVDADTFWRWHKFAPGCWNDSTFLKEFEKKNPECSVKQILKHA